MAKRKIVQIDETKCNGCGLCVPSCAEGAIQIVDGKARLVSDVYCDGLGACLGECPQGAIALVEREAADFGEAAAHRHVAELRAIQRRGDSLPGGCPGASVADFRRKPGELPVLDALQNAKTGPISPIRPPASSTPSASSAPSLASAPLPSSTPSASALGHWPIQLRLVPPSAPFLREADLLLVADCVPFALADFHERFLREKAVAIACPKLDNTDPYVEKLAAIFTHGSIRSLTVIHMEVPCCMGLMRIAQAARQAARVEIPLREVVISTRGQLLRESTVAG